MDGSRLAVVIPAYCESGTIGRIVTAAKEFGPVLVIDDCSPDDTGARAKAAGAVVFRNPTNKGYDGSLIRGLEEARALGFECAVTIDADGEHDPALLLEFRRLLLEARVPLVLGVRPHKQRIAEAIMGGYIKLRFGVDDILCGMKGYRLSALEATGKAKYDHSIGTGPAIGLLRRGAHFVQVPVWGKARVDKPRFGGGGGANWRILRALWRVLLQDIGHIGRRPAAGG